MSETLMPDDTGPGLVRAGLDTGPLEGGELQFTRFQRMNARMRSTIAYIGSESPELVEWQAFNQFRELGFQLVPERDNRSKYKPQGLVESLLRYRDPVKLGVVNREVLDKAKALTLKTFGGSGTLSPADFGSNLFEFVKVEKSSGAPEFSSKGEAFEKDLVRAAAIVRKNRTPDPCVAYHRVQFGDKGPKTRLVWGYPLSMFILESRFAPLLIETFLRKESPMAFGLVKGQTSARMLQVTNSSYRYCLDFSGFDSSIAAEFIDFAFQVLKTHFRRFDREEEVTWRKIITYFIHTPLVMPNLSVWTKHHGVPSGSYFTQLIDSIVNYLAIIYAWLRLSGSRVPDRRILVLGDDSIVGQSMFFRIDNLVGVFRELGLTLNAKKTALTRPGEPVHFLGHLWYGGIPDRPIDEIVKRVVYSEKISGIHNPRDRIGVKVLSLACDSLSGHRVAMAISPARGKDVRMRYSSFVSRTLSERAIESRDRPGLVGLMQDEGIITEVTGAGLANRVTDLGLWIS